jgi:hypothetical protein
VLGQHLETHMPKATDRSRLKAQLIEHGRALNALVAATRRLHRAVSAMAGVAPNSPHAKPEKKRPSTAAGRKSRRRRSGGGRTSQNAEDATTTTTAKAALERHWGNLF